MTDAHYLTDEMKEKYKNISKGLHHRKLMHIFRFMTGGQENDWKANYGVYAVSL